MAISVVIPTVGASPWLVDCLQALRADGGEKLEIILVDQGPEPARAPNDLVNQVLRPGQNLGFAAATNLGLEASRSDLVAMVNDDVVVEAGWFSSLSEALDIDSTASAAQGVIHRLTEPETVDGCGLSFNRWWQAVQLGHGEPTETWTTTTTTQEIFGVSATAALFRRSALKAVALSEGSILDPALGSYYEDVDLACRLRASGFRAQLVPSARAGHAGSVTGNQQPVRRQTLIYGNRHLVSARWMGRSYWGQLPRLVTRDGMDLLLGLGRGHWGVSAGVLRGWARVAGRLHRFARRGEPRPSFDLVRRLGILQ